MSRRLLVTAAVMALALTACGGDNGGIEVTESDYKIVTSPSSASAGELTFNIQNDAQQPHEFVILKSDIAANQLPTDENGDMDETGEGVEPVDEVEDITGGSSKSLTVSLDAGNYVLICNLPGHYRQGMATSFTVS